MDLDLKKSESIKRADLKLEFSYLLLATAFTLFTFIISLNSALVKSNIFLSLQLSLSIPLYFGSIFARAKLNSITKKLIIWERFGFFTFILAYGFMINVIGILLAKLVSINIGLLFWLTNIVSALSYSFLEIYSREANFTSRLLKDMFFIGIIIFFGILPTLGIY